MFDLSLILYITFILISLTVIGLLLRKFPDADLQEGLLTGLLIVIAFIYQLTLMSEIELKVFLIVLSIGLVFFNLFSVCFPHANPTPKLLYFILLLIVIFFHISFTITM